MVYDYKSGTYFDAADAAHVYTYNGPSGAIDTDTITFNGSSWKKTYTYTGSNITSETAWVKQ